MNETRIEVSGKANTMKKYCKKRTIYERPKLRETTGKGFILYIVSIFQNREDRKKRGKIEMSVEETVRASTITRKRS